MAIPNNYYFPYFPSPPPAAKPPSHPTPLPPAAKPPRHSTPPPPAAKPPRHSTPPPPPPAAKPPSHSTTPPPPHQPFRPPPPHVHPPPALPPHHGPPPPPHQPVRPPPPHVHPPPALPPHHGPPPPPHQPFRPPPPHVHPPPALPPHHGPPPPPLPPSPSPYNHPTVIVIVVISFGSVFFLAFLAVALCCFIKKRKKSTIQETKIIHFDEHRKIKEAIVEGPHGPQAVVLSVEDDVHIDEEIRKNEKSDERWPCTSSNVQEETDIIHVAEHETVKEDIVEGPDGSIAVVLTIEDDIHVDEEIRKNERFGKDGHHHHLVHKAGQ